MENPWQRRKSHRENPDGLTPWEDVRKQLRTEHLAIVLSQVEGRSSMAQAASSPRKEPYSSSGSNSKPRGFFKRGLGREWDYQMLQ